MMMVTTKVAASALNSSTGRETTAAAAAAAAADADANPPLRQLASRSGETKQINNDNNPAATCYVSRAEPWAG